MKKYLILMLLIFLIPFASCSKKKNIETNAQTDSLTFNNKKPATTADFKTLFWVAPSVLYVQAVNVNTNVNESNYKKQYLKIEFK